LIGALTVTGIVSINVNSDDELISKTQNNISENKSVKNPQNKVENSFVTKKINNLVPVSSSKTVDPEKSNIASVTKDQSDKESKIQSNNDLAANTKSTVTNDFLPNFISLSQNYEMMSQINRDENIKFSILRAGIKTPRYNHYNDLERSSNSLYIRALVSTEGYPLQGGFNNIVIGYLRSWKNDLSFGAEFGKEPISRLFTDDISNSLVTQSKDVYWAAITLRYEASMFDLAGIRPFAQGRVGSGSDFNYMLGMTTGLVWRSNSIPISISAAYDLNNFSYTHLNNSYNYTKNGFNFGFHYDF
jgi:hypothetical protein